MVRLLGPGWVLYNPYPLPTYLATVALPLEGGR